jgi:hypothetical protein
VLGFGGQLVHPAATASAAVSVCTGASVTDSMLLLARPLLSATSGTRWAIFCVAVRCCWTAATIVPAISLI